MNGDAIFGPFLAMLSLTLWFMLLRAAREYF